MQDIHERKLGGDAVACLPMSPHVRVALVEDDVQFQRALARAVSGAADMTLVSVSGTRADGLLALEQHEVDVLLVDLGLPDGPGTDVIRAARSRRPDCSIMVCTAFGDELHVMQAIEAGAAGYLLKDSSAAAILEQIRSLAAGGSPISPLIARQILTRFQRAGAALVKAAPLPVPDGHNALSARELEVLELVTKGYTADEVAGLLKVSAHTVVSHVRRIYTKLNVHSKAEAIYEARQRGILRS